MVSFFSSEVVPCPPRRNSLSRMIQKRIQERIPCPDSKNLGWRTEGFRGYADLMAGHMRRKSLIQRLVNSSKKQCRFETFCYGPKSCPFYRAGSARKVPGRKGMSYTEEDWVDEDATSHRGPDD
jgi:hypothetical protein